VTGFDVSSVGVRHADTAARTVKLRLKAVVAADEEFDFGTAQWDLIALKERYSTASHELIARRMLEMPPPIVVTLCDLGRVRWRRTNTGSRPPRLLPEENNVWRVAHESGTAASETFDASATGLDSVHCWPIHEVDWKREILRTAIAEW